MFKNYFKTGWRNIMRNKTYSAINMLSIAIGLAAFWMIALYTADELSFDRYNEKASRIVRVVQHTSWNGNEIHQATTSPPFAPALQTAFPEIEDAVRIDLEGGGVIKYDGKKLKQNDIIFADKSLLKIFTYDFLYGNANESLSTSESIVISQTLAEKLFGTAGQAFKQTIYFDDVNPSTITGIIKDIPANSHLRFSAVRPLPADFAGGWQNFYVYTYLLLKQGVDYKALQKKLPQFAAQNIQKIMRVNDYTMELQPLTSIHLHSDLGYELSANGSIKRVYMFIAIGMLTLLIALINYMNLSTARSSVRVKEIGIRKVVGSGRGNLIGLFMTESILTTLIASGIAFFAVNGVLPLFNEIAGKQLTAWRFGQMETITAFIGFAVITGCLSGIYPAFFLSRFKTIPSLKGELGSMHANVLFRRSLVVFQFAITVVMITGSIIIYRQMRYTANADLGFNKAQVLTFHIDDRKVRSQVAALKAQLLQSPLIEGASAAGNPIGNNDLGGMGYKFETPQGDFSISTTMAQELMVDPDYLPTMDIRLLAGRNFSAAVPSDQYGAALINETLMKKLGWKNPVGKRMQFPIDDKGNTAQRTIVGVIKDFHTYSLQHKIEPLVMVMPPVASMEDNLYVKIAKGKIPQGLAYINKVYSQFDKTNVAEYSFLDQNFAKQYGAEQKQGQVSLIFTILAVIIACLGLFGLATFTATQRIKEIGIRKVLGASVGGITLMLSKDFVRLVAIAIVIATPAAWFIMHKWLQDFAYRIDISWWMFVVSGLLSLIIALFTISFRAIKAALANPVEALRTE
ncbi:MAG TPA: ABC transporter permease [Agriterribacter sp.]|nr:ABC transporter permease [Agriterribacter sp.]